MAHVIELATTGRSKCRGCQRLIEKGIPRFGESVPNAFGEGEARHWFHVLCGADRRPQAFKEAIDNYTEPLDNRAELVRIAEAGIENPKLVEIARAEHAPSGRARCRQCRELIEKTSLRLVLERVDDGMISSAGYLHAGCGLTYAGAAARDALRERLQRSNPELTSEDLAQLA